MVLVMLAGVLVASAQAPSGSGWWTGFTVQNPTAGEATTAVEAFWKTDGASTTYVGSAKIGSNNAVTFHPGLDGTCALPPAVAANGCRIAFSPELPSGFEGSAVVSSDAPIVAFANVNNNDSGSVGVSGGKARAAYQGTGHALAANTLFFPTVKVDFSGSSSMFFVQAAGADAETTITYKMNDGSSHFETKTIKANRTYAFVPAAAGVESCNGGNGGGGNVAKCFGGATVTANNPIAGTVVEYAEGASIAKWVLSTRGITPNDTGTTIIAPTMKNDFNGATTGATVLNTDTSQTATVDLSFSVTNVSSGCSASIGDTATDQISVGPQKSVVVNFNQGNVGGLPNCVFYSMKATTAAQGGESIAVTVNENRKSGGQTFKAVYSGFNADNAQDSIFAPLYKEDFNQAIGSLTLVNASSTPTQIDVTMSGSSVHVLRTISLDEGEAVPIRLASNGSPNYTAISGGLPVAGEKYAVTAQAVESGATIVGLYQESSFAKALDVFNHELFE
jgi:hypothetical protein